MSEFKVILTADRSFMSNYHSLPLLKALRFGSTSIFNPSLFFKFISPLAPSMNNGRALIAPYHTRRTEAQLLNNGFSKDDVIVTTPDNIHKVISPRTKIISITVRDPLSKIRHYSLLNPQFHETYCSMAFRKLITNPQLRKYHSKIVVEGPGARQLIDDHCRIFYKIDHVITGEYFSKEISRIFKLIISGQKVPKVINLEHIQVNNTPIIQGGVTEGIVEVSKGCNRGCFFCTQPRLTNRPMKHILKEAHINIRYGQCNITLRNEDIFNYKAKGKKINRKAVLDLYEKITRINGINTVNQSYYNLASMMSEPGLVEEISNLIDVGSKKYPFSVGFTGIETGSTRIIKKYMSGKSHPFPPSKWPEIVEEGFAICHTNNWVPLGSIIIGLPTETKNDISDTSDLIKSLRRYRSIIIPFTYKKTNSRSDTRNFDVKNLKNQHLELLEDIARHNIYWGKKLIKTHFQNRFGIKIPGILFDKIVNPVIENSYYNLMRKINVNVRN